MKAFDSGEQFPALRRVHPGLEVGRGVVAKNGRPVPVVPSSGRRLQIHAAVAGILCLGGLDALHPRAVLIGHAGADFGKDDLGDICARSLAGGVGFDCFAEIASFEQRDDFPENLTAFHRFLPGVQGILGLKIQNDRPLIARLAAGRGNHVTADEAGKFGKGLS